MKNKSQLKIKATIFVLTLILTISLTRIITTYIDLDINIFGYELHHFYYGIIILVIVNIALLFEKNYSTMYTFLSAFSIGLISDEFLFLMKPFQNANYPSTILHAAITTTIILAIFTIFFLHSLNKPQKAKNENNN